MKTTQTWITKNKNQNKKKYIFKILNIKIKLGGVGCKINKGSVWKELILLKLKTENTVAK